MQKIVIPAKLITDPNLTPSDAIVYGLLLTCSYADKNNRPISILTNSEVADVTNFSEKTVSESLKRLNKRGSIKIERKICLFANQTVRRKIYLQMF